MRRYYEMQNLSYSMITSVKKLFMYLMVLHMYSWYDVDLLQYNGLRS